MLELGRQEMRGRRTGPLLVRGGRGGPPAPHRHRRVGFGRVQRVRVPVPVPWVAAVAVAAVVCPAAARRRTERYLGATVMQ